MPGVSSSVALAGGERKERAVRVGIRLLVGLGLVLGAVASCGAPPTPIVLSPDEATQTALPTTHPASAPATLRLGVEAFRGFDPLAAVDEGTEQVQALIYETLLTYDPVGDLQPLLAAAMPVASSDGLTWTFTLWEGVSFHDGTPLEASVAVASLEAVRTRRADDDQWPLAAYAFQQVVTEVTGSGMTLAFHLREPHMALPQLLAEQSLAVTHGEGVGTGPFRLEGPGDGGSEFSLAPNANYHGGRPALDSVRVRVWGGEVDAALAIIEAVNNGAIDLLGSRAPVPVDPAAAYQVWDGPTRETWLIFNRNVPSLDRSGVRLAMSRSPVDRVRALESLANAGLPDGFDLVVWDAVSPPAVEQWRGLFAAVNVEVTLVPVAPSGLWRSLAGRESPLPTDNQAQSSGPPGAFLVSWTRDWAREWWLALAGWDAAHLPVPEADSIGLPVSTEGGLIVHRPGLTGLGVTSGGWPRVTAQTRLP